jgi:hypothetical protein
MDDEETDDFLDDLGSLGINPYYGEVTGAVLFELRVQLDSPVLCSSLFAGTPHMAPAEVLALVPFWLDEDEEPGGPEFWHPPAIKATALRKIGTAFRERMPGAQQLWTRVWEQDGDADPTRDWVRRKMLWRIDAPDEDKNWSKGDWAAHCAFDFDCLAKCAEVLGAHGAQRLRISYHY